MYRGFLILVSVIGIILSLVLGFFSFIIWEVAGILIAISIGVPALIAQQTTDTTILNHKKHGRKYLRNETISVSPIDDYYYELELEKNKPLKGLITSDYPVSVYFLDEKNYRKWDKDKNYDCEGCYESVLKAEIKFDVPKDGTWFVTIENNGRRTAKTRVMLY